MATNQNKSPCETLRIFMETKKGGLVHKTIVRLIFTWLNHIHKKHPTFCPQMAMVVGWMTAEYISSLGKYEYCDVLQYLLDCAVEKSRENTLLLHMMLTGKKDFLSNVSEKNAHHCLVNLFLYMCQVPNNKFVLVHACEKKSKFKADYRMFLDILISTMNECLSNNSLPALLT